MLKARKARNADAFMYYEWANEENVRQQSFSSKKISLEDHIKWFEGKLADPKCIMLVFENEDSIPAGQVRLQKESEDAFVLGISVDIIFRGKGLAVEMLTKTSNYFFDSFPKKKIYAFIKKKNIASVNSFEKAGYINPEQAIQNGIACLKYTKENQNANS